MNLITVLHSAEQILLLQKEMFLALNRRFFFALRCRQGGLRGQRQTQRQHCQQQSSGKPWPG